MENKEQIPVLAIRKIGLKKTLKTWHVWALAVGLVISGEYFGWNYGWDTAGAVGFLIATILVSVMYATFVSSYAELTCALPHAGGPYVFAYRALGPVGGRLAGYATLIEFVFAAPAIAFALGSYFNFLYPELNIKYMAIVFYILFTLINIRGIEFSATIGSIIAIVAIIELGFYFGIVSPHVKIENFIANGHRISPIAIFKSLPYAVWFYLGIEGIAMISEEVQEKNKTSIISKGYITGFLTLVILVFLVMCFTGGLNNSQQFNRLDYPIPSAIATVTVGSGVYSKLFAGFGLVGLLASFHAIILSYARQIMALAREKDLPKVLAQIHPRYRTPHLATIMGSIVGVISILVGETDKLIILSALGAVSMYIMSMYSLIQLRRKEPNLMREFYTKKYMPHITIILTVICLSAIIVTYPTMSIIFACLFVILLLIARMNQRKNNKEVVIEPDYSEKDLPIESDAEISS